MQIPLEITFRDVVKTEALENLIRDRAKRLEKYNNNIIGCRVAVERPNATPNNVNPYRVRIDITVPPGHEIVVERKPGNKDPELDVRTVIRTAFDAARKQLQKLNQKQRRDVKFHPEQQAAAIVTKLHKEEGYGFLTTINGREVYFHKNSVVNEEFDNIVEGSTVNYFEEEGDKGPQASTVRIIEKGKSNEDEIDAPESGEQNSNKEFDW
jgi:cold shock CspA family protein